MIELMLVVAILVVIGGLAVVKLGGLGQNAEKLLVRSELTVIRDAVLRFKQDMGQPPQFVAELFQPPDQTDRMGGWWWRSDGNYPVLDSLLPPLPDSSLYLYDPATRRGWNGPYLQSELLESELLGGINNELKVTRVNPLGAPEWRGEIDSETGMTPPKRIAMLRSDYGSFPQVSKTKGDGTVTRTISHYQFDFSDPSGEVIVRFLDSPHPYQFLDEPNPLIADLDDEIVAEIRLGIKP